MEGTAVGAYHARPESEALGGVVLVPDITGLRPLIEDTVRRLATHGLAVCARRHDVIPVVVSDPVEDELPAEALRGLWPVADSETGATVWVDLSDARTRAAYAQAAREARDRRERTFRKLSLDAVRVKPGDDYVAPLAALFRARGRRR